MNLAKIGHISDIQKTLVGIPNVMIKEKKKRKKTKFGVIWKTLSAPKIKNATPKDF